jgi:hypothetical protein
MSVEAAEADDSDDADDSDVPNEVDEADEANEANEADEVDDVDEYHHEATALDEAVDVGFISFSLTKECFEANNNQLGLGFNVLI